MPFYSIGIDFGINSVRALVVNSQNGDEVSSFAFDRRGGSQAVFLDSRNYHLARQHPGDYQVGLRESVVGAIKAAKRKTGFNPQKVVGIGVDTTGSSPLPVDELIRAYDVSIDRIVCAGGMAEKNELLMQLYADVTGCEIRVPTSNQACALNSAVAAAVLAGKHRNFATA